MIGPPDHSIMYYGICTCSTRKGSVLCTIPAEYGMYIVLCTHRVDVIDLILPLIVLSLDPMAVEVLTDSVEHSTAELVLLPH